MNYYGRAIHAIFITYSVSANYGMKTQKERNEKFNKLRFIKYLLRKKSIYATIEIMEQSIKR